MIIDSRFLKILLSVTIIIVASFLLYFIHLAQLKHKNSKEYMHPVHYEQRKEELKEGIVYYIAIGIALAGMYWLFSWG